MWPRRKRKPRSEAEWSDGGEVAEEVAAFLRGDSVGYFRARSRPIPTWAWINFVAHGSPSAIRLVGRLVPSKREAAKLDPGAQAVWSMAQAVTAYGGGDSAAVTALQRDVLVPLELALMAGRLQVADAQAVSDLALVAVQAGRCPPPG
jgi:hypothetical protein